MRPPAETLAARLEREPTFRPHCPACDVITRMSRWGETGFICDPMAKEDDVEYQGTTIPGSGRFGCGAILEP